MLRVVDGLEVIRNRGFNKVPQLGEFFVPQDGVVLGSRIALVRPSLLALYKAKFFFSQITV